MKNNIDPSKPLYGTDIASEIGPKEPYKGPDYNPFKGAEILKYVELSREELMVYLAFQPDLTSPKPNPPPQYTV